MERNIPSILLIHLISSILSAPPCAATPDVKISQIVRICHPLSWDDAQNYCRTYHSDLITIRNQQEADELAMYEGWIGLHRGSNQWKWSRGDEEATFLIWDTDEPDNGQDCVLKYQSLIKWESDKCHHRHPFLCVDERMILIQEMKTWEEAMLYCTDLQPEFEKTTHSYVLASLPEAQHIVLDRDMIRLKATTDEVWVGLRFLAGEWLWMSGQMVTSSYLPHCPAQQQHCGALVHDENDWRIMNCSEKRNFLCSIKGAPVLK